MNRVFAAGLVLLMGLQAPSLPAPTARTIDFTRDIKPILQNSCIKCHGRGRSKGGFSLETREAMLEGGDSGAALVVGESEKSHLITLVAGLDPDLVMPQKGSRLKPEQIGLLRAWIDQGAAWDPTVNFAKTAPRNIDPREPALPADTGAGADAINPIDRVLAPYLAEHGIASAPLVDDRQFARRVYLDTIGLLPSPAQLQAFLADHASDKRERLVAMLLADKRRYTEHWLTFWNDALRNDYRGTGFIDGGRQQISRWLYTALFENIPYDRFVAQLINPAPGAEGFTKGIIWRGVVNASQTPPMQAAQNVSQVFMGVNLKCASCHDSFINDWQLADAYGLAGIYAEAPLEMVECDRPTGKTAPAKFLYAKLGTIDAKAARPARLEQLAHVITARTNGRLSRTIVNRLWSRFMGRGIVEPLDDMDQPAWNADLLDWLAEDLVAHGYDLKHTMTRILTSRAYQMAAVDPAGGSQADYVFHGPDVRRLSAEQFSDALSSVTGVWQGMPAGDIDFIAALGKPLPTLPAHWIWHTAGADDPLAAPPAVEGAPASPASGAASASSTSTPPDKPVVRPSVTFRKAFSLAALPFTARMVVMYDGPFVVTLNGKKIAERGGGPIPISIDILPSVQTGENVLTIAASRRPPPQPVSAANPVPPAPPPPEPPHAGLLAQVLIHRDPAATALESIAGSDRSWKWQRTGDAEWQAVSDAGDIASAPDLTQQALARTVAAASVDGHARAALVTADPLTLALGRPNREQVVTLRTAAPTTLQALELSNGGTLSHLLTQGAGRLLADKPTSAMLVTRIYQRALGRDPTLAEARACRALLGPAPKADGVQDLLWAVAMLPEFQLIY